MDRREFLRLGAVAAATAACRSGDSNGLEGEGHTDVPLSLETTSPTTTVTTEPFGERFESTPGAAPFSLGVASGLLPDRADSVLLRGFHDNGAAADYEVASDRDFTDVVASGAAESSSVAVELPKRGRPFYYRFTRDTETSPVGRVRLPANDHVRLALTSCQHYEEGFFAAHRHLANENVDAVVHAGDYIYTRSSGTEPVRQHRSEVPTNLREFQRRWFEYKADPDLQAAHAAHPWIVGWDDNEVVSNWGSDVDPDLLAAAYQAWWEHQPVETEAEIARRFTLGDLVGVTVLDTRRFRTPPTCPSHQTLPGSQQCDALNDPDRTMLGADQEQWLADVLGASSARWEIVVSSVVLSEMSVAVGAAPAINEDQWDGYPGQRDRFVDILDDRAIVVSGDIHSGGVAGFAEVPEVIAPSISSTLSTGLELGLSVLAATKPEIVYLETRRRGYAILDLTPDAASVQFRYVSTALDRDATIEDGPSFAIAGA